MATHIALVGDSIFDNRAYTGGEPDVVSHLQAMLPKPWRATLVAVDGSTTASIAGQTARIRSNRQDEAARRSPSRSRARSVPTTCALAHEFSREREAERRTVEC